jgi:hypothetical protein
MSWKDLPEYPAARAEAKRIVEQLWYVSNKGRALRKRHRSPDAATYHLTKQILREKYGYDWNEGGVFRFPEVLPSR